MPAEWVADGFPASEKPPAAKALKDYLKCTYSSGRFDRFRHRLGKNGAKVSRVSRSASGGTQAGMQAATGAVPRTTVDTRRCTLGLAVVCGVDGNGIPSL